MRQFERDDVAKAALGDADAAIRVARRKEVLQFFAERRQEALKRATPAWANKKAISAIYAEARRLTKETGIRHEVDHVVPIQHPRVCGLHVEHNLQILEKSANISKHAKFDPAKS